MTLGTTFMHFLTSTWSETDISAFLIAFLQMHPVWLPIKLWLLFGIFVQKVFETNVNFRYQRVKNQKNKDSYVTSILIVDKKYMFSFFLISYSLAPKIEICPKYFLHKKFQKQPLWYDTSILHVWPAGYFLLKHQN